MKLNEKERQPTIQENKQRGDRGRCGRDKERGLKERERNTHKARDIAVGERQSGQRDKVGTRAVCVGR